MAVWEIPLILWNRTRIPTGFLNFIACYYIFLVAFILLGSVILYGIGHVPYIDALVLASGACTQTALHTFDLTRLHLSQQIILFVWSFICGIPIDIPAMLYRIYLFEKRFQAVIQEASRLRSRRGERSNTSRARRPFESSSVPRREISVNRRLNRVIREDMQHEDDDRRAFERMVQKALRYTGQQAQIFPAQQDTTTQNTLQTRSIGFSGDTETNKNHQSEDAPHDGEILSGELGDTEERPRRLREISFQDPVSDAPPPNKHAAQLEAADIPQDARSSPDNREPGGVARRFLHLPGVRTFRRTSSSTSDPMPYLSWTPDTSRNSPFVDLTEEQREELGGIEYRTLKTLLKIHIGLLIGLHSIGFIGLIPWISREHSSKLTDSATVSRPWLGAFLSVSAVNNWGFTLTRDSLSPFQGVVWPFLLISFLSLAGKPAMPCVLRATIWMVRVVFSKHGSGLWEELMFALDHPRRVSTLLLPGRVTWLLACSLFIFYGFNWMFFMTLNLGNLELSGLNTGARIMAGILQAVATKSAGFTMTDLSKSSPAMQSIYMVFMHLPVGRVTLIPRQTNVYEEKSLRIPRHFQDNHRLAEWPRKTWQRIHKQAIAFVKGFGQNLGLVYLAFIVIVIVENSKVSNAAASPSSISLFAVLFEVVSAYNNIGFSLRSFDAGTSLCGDFKSFSKLLIIGMELAGRSKEIPIQVDNAILLPSESLQRRDIINQGREGFARRLGSWDSDLEAQSFSS